MPAERVDSGWWHGNARRGTQTAKQRAELKGRARRGRRWRSDSATRGRARSRTPFRALRYDVASRCRAPVSKSAGARTSDEKEALRRTVGVRCCVGVHAQLRRGVFCENRENVTMTSQLDQWLEITSQCKYLPEPDLRKLCDYVRIDAQRTRARVRAC